MKTTPPRSAMIDLFYGTFGLHLSACSPSFNLKPVKAETVNGMEGTENEAIRAYAIPATTGFPFEVHLSFYKGGGVDVYVGVGDELTDPALEARAQEALQGVHDSRDGVAFICDINEPTQAFERSVLPLWQVWAGPA